MSYDLASKKHLSFIFYAICCIKNTKQFERQKINQMGSKLYQHQQTDKSGLYINVTYQYIFSTTIYVDIIILRTNEWHMPTSKEVKFI